MGCPLEFVMSQGACVVKCPTLYKLKVVDGVPSCVVESPSGENIVKFGLTSVAPMEGAVLDQEAARGTSVVHFPPDFKDAYASFERDLAIANSILGRTAAKDQLFTALQTAENARDTAPDAYQAARTAYYTLVNGPTWVEQEKTRIANVEAQPIVNGYVARYNDIQAKKNQQQSTIEVVDGVRDKILTVKDDLVFSVSTFQKQIDDIKNQINKNRVKQAQTIAATSSWVDTFLNWVIALVTLIAIVLLGRRFMTKGGPAPTIEEVEAKARYIRAQAMLRNANTRGPRGWLY